MTWWVVGRDRDGQEHRILADTPGEVLELADAHRQVGRIVSIVDHQGRPVAEDSLRDPIAELGRAKEAYLAAEIAISTVASTKPPPPAAELLRLTDVAKAAKADFEKWQAIVNARGGG